MNWSRKYERIRVNGRTVYLKVLSDDGRVLTGIEVNRFGDEKQPKEGAIRVMVFDHRDISLRTKLVMNMKYAELEDA